jgi:starvation-inducible outer membrane lipoprotein
MKAPTTLAIALVVLLAACASHPKRLNCDGHLKPINAPAPAVAAGTHP